VTPARCDMATVAEIAEKICGQLTGDGSSQVTGLAGVRDSSASELTFLSNPRYADDIPATSAAAVIVDSAWQGECPVPVIRVKDVEKAFAQAIALFAPPPVAAVIGVHATAVVADDVVLGANTSVGAHCVIEAGATVGENTVVSAGCYLAQGTVIGSDCMLYPHVSTREGTRIGDRAIIHNGVVLGSDGYGFIPEEKDGKVTITKIQHTGIVDIGNDVEIGANVTIDRARFGKTRIGNNVKIDNLVHIAHNVTIGDNSGVVAQVGISGSTTVGSRVILWGQAGIAGHLNIGDDAVVGAQAGVTKDVEPGSYVTGYPAMPHDKAAKAHAGLMRIPHLKKRIIELEERIKELEERG
jgi:UDP-3-O-[3-hydroxymyristoyl] glucosamine N-acyltransferase